MNRVEITEEFFSGAVSLEKSSDGITPWRIPYRDAALFPPHAIEGKAAICAGVRLRVRTDSTCIITQFSRLEADARMDCLVGDQIAHTVELHQGDTQAEFSGMSAGWKVVEIYLPQNIGMTISSLWIDSEAQLMAIPDERPIWVAYGSSITQCVDARSPSLTWPALVSRQAGLNLTCLGYSGNCHLEPMVGRLIRDLPASLISLCVGINVYGAASLSPRTFKPALIGMLQTIRDRHVNTPLLVISPIFAPEREVTANKLGYTLPVMRQEIEETVALFRARGDHQIVYLSGLDLLGPDMVHHLPDGLHPDAAGYEHMADRFVKYFLSAFR